jgi:uncharacterized phage-like protein YoqJ
MSTEFIERVLCFTGHRPNKLGGYSGEEAEGIRKCLLGHLARLIERAARKGYTTFISGGAQGVDQIAAEAVINRRANPEFAHIKLVIARPFPSQHIKWPYNSQKRFHEIVDAADVVVDVSPDPYAPWKMQVRNEFMVNQSRTVVAVWDGTEKGGTWNCIRYAVKMDRAVLVIHPLTLAEKWVFQL